MKNKHQQSRASDCSTSQIESFLDLVVKWNSVAGLVAKGDITHLKQNHYQDSLCLIPHLLHSKRHLDIGSGGGFPAIPLAISRPDIDFTLIERSHKKSHFLKHAVMTLSLDNVQVIEHDVRGCFNLQPFETITARAVAPMAEVWKWCRRLLVDGGCYLAQTGEPVDELIRNGRIVSQLQLERGWLTSIQLNSA